MAKGTLQNMVTLEGISSLRQIYANLCTADQSPKLVVIEGLCVCPPVKCFNRLKALAWQVGKPTMQSNCIFLVKESLGRNKTIELNGHDKLLPFRLPE